MPHVELSGSGDSDGIEMIAGTWEYQIVADTYDPTYPVALKFTGENSNSKQVDLPDPDNDGAATARTAAGPPILHEHGGGTAVINVSNIGTWDGLKLIATYVRA